jgi:hypothetical protein
VRALHACPERRGLIPAREEEVVVDQPSPRELAEGIRNESLDDEAKSLRFWAHNRWVWIGSSIGGVLGGAGAAVSGLTGSATIAGVFGLLATLAAGTQATFKPDEMRVVHRQKAAAVRALAQDIQITIANRVAAALRLAACSASPSSEH